ncbi:hypothetical protein ACR3K2_13960 [Cryptosporidium serpentis]
MVNSDGDSLISYFVHLTAQRKSHGLTLSADILNSSESKKFLDYGKHVLHDDYMKSIEFIKQVANERFDSDVEKRIEVCEKLEKILKSDHIYSSLIISYISQLLNDKDVAVVISAVDFLHRTVNVIIPNVLLPLSVKHSIVYTDLNIEQNWKNSLCTCTHQHVSDTQLDFEGCKCCSKGWWSSRLSVGLCLATNTTLRNLGEVIKCVARYVETYGKGGASKISWYEEHNEMPQSIHFSCLTECKDYNKETRDKIYTLESKNEAQYINLYRRCLKLSNSILQMCSLNLSGHRKVNESENKSSAITTSRTGWVYPINSGKVYSLEEFPIEILVNKDTFCILESIVNLLCKSMELVLTAANPLKEELGSLNLCLGFQCLGWLCFKRPQFLSRFFCSIKQSIGNITNFEKKSDEKLLALQYICQKELLRIFACPNLKYISLYTGEIVNLLRLLGRTEDFNLLRLEAYNIFNSFKSTNEDIRMELKKRVSNIGDDTKSPVSALFPPAEAQRSRSISSRYSYKRTRYNVNQGYYEILPQSVIEGVSWLFATKNYSNIVDTVLANFLNPKLPDDILVEVEQNCLGKKINLDTFMNLSNTPWTNRFSPLADNKLSIENKLLDKQYKLNSHIKESDCHEEDDQIVTFYECTITDSIEKMTMKSDTKYSNNTSVKDLYGMVVSPDSKWLKSKSTSIKAVIFAQIASSLLLSPLISLSAEGVYESVDPTNNSLASSLKYGQQIISAWELFFRRILDSGKEKFLPSFESYGSEVGLAWGLFSRRLNEGFISIKQKYNILIRLSMLHNKLENSFQWILIETIIFTLFSETNDLLLALVLVSDTSSHIQNKFDINKTGDALNVGNEYIFVFMDNLLKEEHNGERIQEVFGLPQIICIGLLWSYGIVWEYRVEILLNILFRFYSNKILNIAENNSLNFTLRKIDVSKNFINWKWLITGLYCEREESTNIVYGTQNISDNKISGNDRDAGDEFCYNQIFDLGLRVISSAIASSDHPAENISSCIILSTLHKYFIECPEVPISSVISLYDDWILGEAQTRRLYAINILCNIINKKNPESYSKRAAYFALLSCCYATNVYIRQDAIRYVSNRFSNLDISCNGNQINCEKNNLPDFEDLPEWQRPYVLLKDHETKSKNIEYTHNYRNSTNLTYIEEIYSAYTPLPNSNLLCDCVEYSYQWYNSKIYGERWVEAVAFLTFQNCILEDSLSENRLKICCNPFIERCVKCISEQTAVFATSKVSETFKDMELLEKNLGDVKLEIDTDNMVKLDKNENNDLNTREDIAKIRCNLYKYCCIKKPVLIHFLFYLSNYVNHSSSMFTSVFEPLLDEIVRSIPEVYHPEYIRIVKIYGNKSKDNNCYLRFITLILRIIASRTTDESQINKDLLTELQVIFEEFGNLYIVVPMIGFYELDIIKHYLPILVNTGDKMLLKYTIQNILSPDGKHLENSRIKSKISSEDLLRMAISYSYPEVKNVDARRAVDIVDCCFELTQISPPLFDSDTIASVLGRFAQEDMPTFPRTLGRAMVLSILYIPSIKPFIASFVISSLIRSRRVWDDALTWRGIRHCIQKLWTDYKNILLPSLILLPRNEFEVIFHELLETNSDLRVDCLDIIKRSVSLYPLPVYNKLIYCSIINFRV